MYYKILTKAYRLILKILPRQSPAQKNNKTKTKKQTKQQTKPNQNNQTIFEFSPFDAFYEDYLLRVQGLY